MFGMVGRTHAHQRRADQLVKAFHASGAPLENLIVVGQLSPGLKPALQSLRERHTSKSVSA